MLQTNVWLFDSLFSVIDFCENLKLPVKFEPQWLQWCHESITVHSGKHYGKTSRRKKLPPLCVRQQQKHDLVFVTHVLKEMLEIVKNIPKSCGYCSSQYKSAQHFDNIQNICNKISVPIIRLFSVTTVHVKGKSTMLGDWQNNLHINMRE